jgi:hypothetical protein
MKEPTRLLRADATRLERSLLEAVKSECPSPDQSLRMRMALGLPVTGLAATGIKAAAAAWGQATLLAVVAAAVVGTTSSSAPRLDGAGPSVVRPHGQAPVRAAEPAPVTSATDFGALEPAPDPPKPAAPASSRASAPSDVREEIRLLDQARDALKSEQPAQALERLAVYTARFPRGAFRQEAMVLRIEALGRSGDQARARAMANRFLKEHPESPHAERVVRSVASAGP